MKLKTMKMSSEKKSNFFWILFILIIVGAGMIKIWQNYHWSSVFIELKDKRLEVLLARTYGQQYRGLGKRDDLGIYQGMLFAHSLPDKYGIVMRAMRFPIDIVWFYNGEIVDIAPNVPTEPGVSDAQLRIYRPRKPANMVLELPAGWTKENGVKIGDLIEILDI